MSQVNPRALYVLAFTFALLGEVCFIPVLSVFATKAARGNTTFCWSWKIGTPRADNDKSCPFLVFFLAALVNSCLLLFTGIYFALRLCLVADYFQNLVFVKYVIKYSHFVLGLITTLLSLVFIAMMFAYNSYSYDEEEKYTGGIANNNHYYLILVCTGGFLSLLSTVFSAMFCCRTTTASSSEFATGGGVFSVFTDYSEPLPDYEQIN